MPKQKSKPAGKPAAAAPDAAEQPASAGAAKARGKRKARSGDAKAGLARGEAAKVAGKAGAKKKTQRKAALRKVRPAVEAIASVGRVVLKKKARPILRPGPLERLEVAIDEVRHGGRISVRTRKLQLSGLPKMAQKVIEEAGEVAIEAILGDRVALINESADLFYNLVVLLHAANVPLAVVLDEMERREITLGMAEKLPKTVDPDG